MNLPATYLDYCASAPVKPSVARLMTEILDETGNASSVHAFGRARRARVEKARGQIADHFCVKPAQVIFTSGATESNNTILNLRRRRIVSSIEHPSILKAAGNAAHIRAQENGVIDLNHLEDLLKAENAPALVCLMLVNNETGVIQPVRRAAALCKEYGALLHCDAVAAVGRLAFGLGDLGCDSLGLCAHKIGGPQGAGALILRDDLEITPLLRGGGQEGRRRAGTENVAAIAGFGEAVALCEDDLVQAPLWRGWRKAFERVILDAAPDAVIFGKDAPHVASIISLAMPGAAQDMQMIALDLEGFAVSAGSACGSGRVEPSHVLKAMGAGRLAGNAVRVSFGWATRPEELEALAAAWTGIYGKKRGQMACAA